MKRHRYRTLSADRDSCTEGFGGPARCTLPLAADVHWQDDYHPYSEGVISGLCDWRMQSRGPDQGAPCGRTHYVPEHNVGQLRPPDEDGVRNLRTGEPATEVLTDVDIDMTALYRDARTIVTAVEGGGVGAPWERAERALREDGRVGVGPWSVRCYELPLEDTEYADLLMALGRIREPYTAVVYWVESERRMAYVTWGDYNGWGPTECADEIRRVYGLKPPA